MENQERRSITITIEQLEQLAEDAAKKAATETVDAMRTHFMQSVGETVVNKVVYLFGIGLLYAYWYLQDKGLLK